jgi:hypothetical protein
MSQTTQTVAPLSPHWAFVVQLREGTPLTPEGVQGRVEHITSGRVTDFSSLAGLLAFMQAVLPPSTEQLPSAAQLERTPGSAGGRTSTGQ